MLAYIWPIGLVVVSNIVYQICTKSVPESMNAFAALALTYLTAAVISAVLYFTAGKGGNILHEFGKTNWAPLVLGVVIIGLETGFIYAYKAGWPVSTASIVQSAFLAVALLIVGFVAYHEKLTVTKVVGILICLVGLYFVNK